jgi:6-phosphogluconolactonase
MRDIETFPDAAGWADACAERLTDTLAAAIAETGKAVFAGSGGSTPTPIYRVMSGTDLDWSKVAVTLIDERYVPETSPDSNAALIKQTLMTGPAAAARFVPLFHPSVTVDRAAASPPMPWPMRAGVSTRSFSAWGRMAISAPCSRKPDPEDPALPDPSAHRSGRAARPRRRGPQPRAPVDQPAVSDERPPRGPGPHRQAKRAVFEREAAGDPRVQPIAALLAAKVPLDVLWTEKA